MVYRQQQYYTSWKIRSPAPVMGACFTTNRPTHCLHVLTSTHSRRLCYDVYLEEIIPQSSGPALEFLHTKARRLTQYTRAIRDLGVNPVIEKSPPHYFTLLRTHARGRPVFRGYSGFQVGCQTKNAHAHIHVFGCHHFVYVEIEVVVVYYVVERVWLDARRLWAQT